MNQQNLPYQYKIVDWQMAQQQVSQWQSDQQKVVFTNGCFDLLHPGHIHLLESARKKGYHLIIGLNSDNSIRRIKGANRPVNDFIFRSTLLASLSMVSLVVSFEEDTPLQLIEHLSPDILVKGGDWPVDKIVGATFVQSQGGQVFSLPIIEGYSSTRLIEKIKKH